MLAFGGIKQGFRDFAEVLMVADGTFEFLLVWERGYLGTRSKACSHDELGGFEYPFTAARILGMDAPNAVSLLYILDSMPKEDAASQGSPIIHVVIDIVLQILGNIFRFKRPVIRWCIRREGNRDIREPSHSPAGLAPELIVCAC